MEYSASGTAALFSAGIRQACSKIQCLEYLLSTATDDEYEFMREGGMFDDDVISGAADAILFERARTHASAE